MTELALSSTDSGPAKRRHRRVKPQLLTREHLDGRTNAAKAFDSIATSIANDLGGEAALATVQKHLVEAFAGVAIVVNDMNARKALGQDVDLLQQSQAISTLVRLAARIGVRRIAKDITPDDPLVYKPDRADEDEP
jgi:hypothetical protein